MTNVVGFYSACELVRMNSPFDAAVTALVGELGISETDAVAAMNAAHERVDWGSSQALSNAGRA
jgi:hypothetical protein